MMILLKTTLSVVRGVWVSYPWKTRVEDLTFPNAPELGKDIP
jgi:hypothetical protein